MLTSSFGYAVAGSPSGKVDEYLVATNDGGKSWSVRGLLPYSFMHWSTQPALHFVSANVGYTQIPTKNYLIGTSSDESKTRRNGYSYIPQKVFSVGLIYVTTNGGRSWRPLSMLGNEIGDQSSMGLFPSYGDYQFSNGVLAVVSDECSKAELVATEGSGCPSAIAWYRPGAIHPFSTHQIPTMGLPRVVPVPVTASLVDAVSSATAIVQESWYGSIFVTRDLVTTDGGGSWRAFDLPCGATQPSELLVVPGHEWIQECTSLINGYQGSMYLFATTNGGRNWKSIASASAPYGPDGYYVPKGQVLAGARYEFLTNQSGSVLWGVDISWTDSGGPSMVMSSNGGRTWTPSVVSGHLFAGGPAGSFSASGTTGLLVTPTGVAYRTTNGSTWVRARLLAAR
jgi:photosystem II stability/assembly factor-like uncharacterized protein